MLRIDSVVQDRNRIALSLVTLRPGFVGIHIVGIGEGRRVVARHGGARFALVARVFAQVDIGRRPFVFHEVRFEMHRDYVGPFGQKLRLA